MIIDQSEILFRHLEKHLPQESDEDSKLFAQILFALLGWASLPDVQRKAVEDALLHNYMKYKNGEWEEEEDE